MFERKEREHGIHKSKARDVGDGARTHSYGDDRSGPGATGVISQLFNAGVLGEQVLVSTGRHWWA